MYYYLILLCNYKTIFSRFVISIVTKQRKSSFHTIFFCGGFCFCHKLIIRSNQTVTAHLIMFSKTHSPRNSPLHYFTLSQLLPILHHDFPLSPPPPPPLTLSLCRRPRRRCRLPRSDPLLLPPSKLPKSLRQNPLLLRRRRQHITGSCPSRHLRQPLPRPRPLPVSLRRPPAGVEAAARGGE